MQHKQSAQRLLLALALLAAGALSVANDDKAYNINDFKRKYFKIITSNSGFYKVNAGLENLTDHQPLVYGYIDKDLYTDIVTISKDRRTTSFFFYNDVEGVFDHKMDGPVLDQGERVVAVKLTVAESTASFPDVIYITENTSDFGLTMRLFKIEGNADRPSLAEVPSFRVSTKTVGSEPQEPVNFQLFSSSALVDYWLVNDNGERKLISFNRNTKTVDTRAFADLIDTTCAGCLPLDTIKDRVLNTVGTNAFIDLDRDCRADLMLQSTDSSGGRALEVFLYGSNGKFGLRKLIPLDKGLTFGAFVDINQDNAVDLLFWSKSDQKLITFFGLVEGADKLKANVQCVEQGLPVSFPSLENRDDKRYWLSQDLVVGAVPSEAPDMRVFPLLRFADLDLDGFPDLIMNLKLNDKDDVFIFKNSACSTTKTSDGGKTEVTTLSANSQLVPACRMFVLESDADKIAVMKGRGALQSSAFDFGERGLANKQDRPGERRAGGGAAQDRLLHQQLRG